MQDRFQKALQIVDITEGLCSFVYFTRRLKTLGLPFKLVVPKSIASCALLFDFQLTHCFLKPLLTQSPPCRTISPLSLIAFWCVYATPKLNLMGTKTHL